MNKILIFLAFLAPASYAMDITVTPGGKVKANGKTEKVIRLNGKKLSRTTLVDIEIKDQEGFVVSSVTKKVEPNTKDVISLSPNNIAHIRTTTTNGPLSMDFTSGEFNIKKELAKVLAKEEKEKAKEKTKEKRSSKRSSDLRNSYKEKKSVAFADLPKKK